MQNEHHFPSGTEGKVECQRPEEEKWAEFVRDLEMLGAQLSELSSHPAVLGDHFIQRLNTQYQTVCNRADVWKQTTDQQIDAIRKLADYQGREAQGTFSDIRGNVQSRCVRARKMLAKAWSALGPNCAHPLAKPRIDFRPRRQTCRRGPSTSKYRSCLGILAERNDRRPRPTLSLWNL